MKGGLTTFFITPNAQNSQTMPFTLLTWSSANVGVEMNTKKRRQSFDFKKHHSYPSFF
jgi:hypothetical protein